MEYFLSDKREKNGERRFFSYPSIERKRLSNTGLNSGIEEIALNCKNKSCVSFSVLQYTTDYLALRSIAKIAFSYLYFSTPRIFVFVLFLATCQIFSCLWRFALYFIIVQYVFHSKTCSIDLQKKRLRDKFVPMINIELSINWFVYKSLQ